MRFFNFIEQDHAVWFTADGFSKLTAFLITNISWRCTHQAAYAMAFLIFAHIYSGHCTFVVEEILCQGFCEFGFSNSCSSKKEETADGFFLVLQSSSTSTDGITHGFYGFILAHYALVQVFF